MTLSYTGAALIVAALLLADVLLLILVLVMLRHYAESMRGQIDRMHSSDLHRLSTGLSEANERLRALGVRTRKEDA